MVKDDCFDLEIEKLNYQQKAAVMHNEGKALVVAGPGSGKTMLIITRAARLARAGKKVTTLAFNVKAAAEMTRRYKVIEDKYGIKKDLCEFSTIHSFCYKIINAHYRKKGMKPPIVLDDICAIDLVKDIYGDILNKKAVNSDEIRDTITYFGKKSSGLVDIKNRTQIKTMPYYDSLYFEYEKRKAEKCMIDFEDMISKALDIIKETSIKGKNICEYMQIDEAQDISPKQYELLYSLKNNNMMLVGDDCQSIYGFRGADPGCLMKYFSDDRNCKLYFLEENYRSGEKIVNLSSDFIMRNTVRLEKHVFTDNDFKCKIRLLTPENAVKQAEFALKHAISNAGNNKSVGILFRNNDSSFIPEIMLRDLLLNKMKNNMKLPRIIFSEDTVTPAELATFKILYLKIKAEEMKHSHNLKTNETIFKELRDFGILSDSIIEDESAGKREFVRNVRMDALNYVISNCKRADEIKNACFGVIEKSEEADNNRGSIMFSTIHSSKGLEFDVVFIIDLIEGEFPSRCADFTSIEEERRLMYVALTRAKKDLYVMSPKIIGDKLMTQSIFFREIQDLLKNSDIFC